MNLNPKKKADTLHRSADRTTRFWEDQVLRAVGAVVASRPKVGETIWRMKDGRLLGEAAAIAEQLGTKLNG
jgi:hypothetical protein